VQASDGNFYGTTFRGGANGYGMVFKITPGGTLITLHSFNGTDGSYSQAGLVQATDGNFYGTTSGGGTNCYPYECGTVFKITPNGTLTTLYNFCSQSNCSDGDNPTAALVQATDGNFYGTTEGGGASGNCGSHGCGTLFKITPGGMLPTVHASISLTATILTPLYCKPLTETSMGQRREAGPAILAKMAAARSSKSPLEAC